MQTIKIHWYDSNCFPSLGNCCFTLLSYKCNAVKNTNATHVRNKKIRNLNIPRKAMLFLKADGAYMHFRFLLQATCKSLAWSKPCRCSCRYLTFGSPNFYLYSFILTLPSFSVSKQTHFSCSVFSCLYFHPLLHNKLGTKAAQTAPGAPGVRAAGRTVACGHHRSLTKHILFPGLFQFRFCWWKGGCWVRRESQQHQE